MTFSLLHKLSSIAVFQFPDRDLCILFLISHVTTAMTLSYLDSQFNSKTMSTRQTLCTSNCFIFAFYLFLLIFFRFIQNTGIRRSAGSLPSDSDACGYGLKNIYFSPVSTKHFPPLLIVLFNYAGRLFLSHRLVPVESNDISCTSARY